MTPAQLTEARRDAMLLGMALHTTPEGRRLRELTATIASAWSLMLPEAQALEAATDVVTAIALGAPEPVSVIATSVLEHRVRHFGADLGTGSIVCMSVFAALIWARSGVRR